MMMKSMMGLKNPKVESYETINELIYEVGCSNFPNYTLVGTSDSSIIYNNIFKSSIGSLLFDSLGNRLCRLDKKKCTGVVLSELFKSGTGNDFILCQNDTANLTHVLKELQLVCGSQYEKKHDYYLVFYWSRFLGGERRVKDNLKWIKSISNNSEHDIAVILVNTDLQESWGLKKGDKMKLKIKFIGNKSASVILGEIPYI
jgi:hypothetical protein